jgi:hypothetical protein
VIKPIPSEAQSINGIKPNPIHDQLSGWFRLKEFDASLNKEIETDLVTYFIRLKEGSEIELTINCAKPINLSYRLSDSKEKHTRLIQEPGAYQRIIKTSDIASFRNGLCKMEVLNEKGVTIFTIEFEKVEI